MRRNCGHCGAEFEGRTSRATYCATRCRVAANRAKRTGVVLELPVPAAGESLVDAISRAVGDRESDPLAQIALVLARRIVDGRDAGSSVAALARELRATLTALGTASAGAPAVGSRVAQFRSRRAAAGNR